MSCPMIVTLVLTFYYYSVPAGTVPVDASLNFTLTGEGDFGAVLLTEKVQQEQSGLGIDVAVDWVKENIEGLLKRKSDIETYGMWIVTSIWTTNAARITTLDHSQRSVDFKLSAGVTGIAKLDPKFENGADSNTSIGKTFAAVVSRLRGLHHRYGMLTR
jgi:hypothetical protein